MLNRLSKSCQSERDKPEIEPRRGAVGVKPHRFGKVHLRAGQIVVAEEKDSRGQLKLGIVGKASHPFFECVQRRIRIAISVERISEVAIGVGKLSQLKRALEIPDRVARLAGPGNLPANIVENDRIIRADLQSLGEERIAVAPVRQL